MADNGEETRENYEEQWVPEKYLEEYNVDRNDNRETNIITSLRETLENDRPDITDKMADREKESRKKHEEHWVPENFLEQYYVDRYDESETWHIKSLHEAVETGKIKGSRVIEIGSGPTVHRMAVLARVCDEILACDYTPSNLDFLKHFLEDSDASELVKKSLHELASLEGYKDLSAGANALIDRVRPKVKHIVQVDVNNSESVQNLLNYGGEFDCAHCCGCLEVACVNYESYVKALKNINIILKPGAVFILSGDSEGTFYVVNGVKYDILNWDADFAKRGLREAGFRIDFFIHREPSCIKEEESDSTGSFFSICIKI